MVELRKSLQRLILANSLIIVLCLVVGCERESNSEPQEVTGPTAMDQAVPADDVGDGTDDTEQVPEGWARYASRRLQIEFIYPEDWYIDDTYRAGRYAGHEVISVSSFSPWFEGIEYVQNVPEGEVFGQIELVGNDYQTGDLINYVRTKKYLFPNEWDQYECELDECWMGIYNDTDVYWLMRRSSNVYIIFLQSNTATDKESLFEKIVESFGVQATEPVGITVDTDDVEWVVHEDKLRKIKFEYPADWYLDTDAIAGRYDGFPYMRITSFVVPEEEHRGITFPDEGGTALSIGLIGNGYEHDDIVEYTKSQIGFPDNTEWVERTIAGTRYSVGIDTYEAATDVWLIANGSNVFGLYVSNGSSGTQEPIVAEIISRFRITQAEPLDVSLAVD